MARFAFLCAVVCVCSQSSSTEDNWSTVLKEGRDSLIEGKLEEARSSFSRAVLIAEQEFGENSAEAFLSLRDLATAYKSTGDVQRSAEILEKCLEICRLGGCPAAEIPRTWNQAAWSYEALGRSDDAERAYLKAIDFSSDRSRLPYVLNLASFYSEIGKLNDAHSLLDAEIRAVQLKGVFAARLLEKDAEVLDALGQQDAARQRLKSALGVWEMLADTEAEADFLVLYGSFLERIGEADEAGQLRRRAAEMRTRLAESPPESTVFGTSGGATKR